MPDEIVVKKKRVYTYTPEQKAKKSLLNKARLARRTPEQKAWHIEQALARLAALDPTQRADRRAKKRTWWASLTPEQRSMTPEQRGEHNARRRAKCYAMTPEQRVSHNLASRLRKPALTPEQRARRYELSQVWAVRNPERVGAYKRTNRAKRANAEGVHAGHDIKALFAHQRGTCPNCQALLIKRGIGKYHVDHIMPLALGGSNWPSNLQLLCPPCNLDKNAKHPDVWMADNPRKRAVDFIPF